MKKAIVIVLLISSLFSVFGTGMPVIDVVAIAQAVQSAMTQVNQWNQQLKQWQSEYERVRKAAEKISSGDFTTVVSGLASLSSQMSGWTSNLGWSETSDWLETASDGSYSLLAMTTNYQLLLNNAERLSEIIQKNVEKLTESADAWEAGSNAFQVTTSSGDYITSLITNAGRMGLNALDLTSDVMELLKISPKEAASLYENALLDSLKKAGFNSYEELLKKIESMQSELTKAEAELLDISASESPNAHAQKQAQIEQLKTQLENLQALKKTYLSVASQLAQIEQGQSAYEKQMKEKQEEELAQKQADAEATALAQLDEALNNFINSDVNEILNRNQE
jgi:flagellar biosynthesis chaperone FliJ